MIYFLSTNRIKSVPIRICVYSFLFFISKEDFIFEEDSGFWMPVPGWFEGEEAGTNLGEGRGGEGRQGRHLAQIAPVSVVH